MQKAIIMGCIFLGLLTTGTAHARFWDVSDSHAYGPAIDFLMNEGVVRGYPDRSFRADNPVSRAEFVKIIVSVLFQPYVIDACLENLQGNAEALDTIRFEDISYLEWYGPYLCIAVLGDMIDGYPDRTFRPEEGVSFAEAAKILANAYGVLNPDHHDINVQSEVWFKPYVDDLSDLEVIPPTIRGFAFPITRGEMAEMIYRLENIYVGNLTTNRPSIDYSDLAPQTTRLPYKSAEHGFYLTYPEIWPAPYFQKRGIAHDGVPVIRSTWRLYMGHEDIPCKGLGTCNERRFYLDGYKNYNFDQLITDLYAESSVQILDDTLTNTEWRIVYLENQGDCRSKRALIIRNNYVYRLTALCSEQSPVNTQHFDDLLESFLLLKFKD